MSGNIDRRIVEMRFDNKDFEKNTQDTMNILEKLKEKLAFKNAGKDFDASGLSSSVDRVANRFSALEIIGMTTLVNLTNAAVNLGKNLAKSLTIDQVRAGFSEYELKMGSMQTIMASTGESIETVNGYLNQLNAYADRTIYSFSDMTQNIGKFTNAGVKLEDAVNAIKGISNEAALSGANAQEASRAMYNFAQALSAGYVKLIDWKSIENANMATKGFKQQLIETAVAMGKLEKTTDGYKSTTTDMNGKISEAFTSTKGFNESLAHQWMTTDVLTQTLQNYSVDLEHMTESEKKAWREQMKSIGYTEDQIKAVEKLSKQAYAAAQDVKTFSQLMDTVKEAIGSGWAQTFEIIFGNLEEAKKLWTAVNKVISGFVDRTSKARNGILQTWKDLGGRQDIANGLKAAFGAIGSAFNQAFPAPSEKRLEAIGQKLKDITQSFEGFGKRIAKHKDDFADIFKAFHDVIGLFASAFSGLFNILGGGKGVSPLTIALEFFIEIAAAAARGVSKIVSFVKAIGSVFGVFSNLKGPLTDVKKGFDNVFDAINPGKISFLDGIAKVFSTIASALGKVLSAIGEGLSQLSLGGIGGLLAGGGLFAAGTKLSGLLDTITKKVEDAKNTPKMLDSIKTVLGELSTSLRDFQTSIKAKALLTIASAVGILAASCLVLSGIPIKKLAAAITAMGFLLGELTAASMFMQSANVKGIIKIAAAIYILSKALKTLAEVEDVGKGLSAIAALMLELLTFFSLLNTIKLNPERLTNFAGSMILIGIALNLMAKPVKDLSQLSLKELGKGLLGIGGALLIFAGFFALMQSKVISTTAPRINSIAKSLIIFAVALNLLAIPIKVLGSMDIKSLAKGLGGIVGALIIFGGFVAAMSKIDFSGKQIMAVAASLLVMGVAVNIMAGALAILGSFDAGPALSTLFGTLLILGIAVKALEGSLAGAAAMIIIAGALMIIAPAIALLSGLNFEGVIVGLVALSGTIGVFAAATVLLAPIIPLMLALSVAMAVLGAGALGLGAGMLMLSMAFATGVTPIIMGIVELAKTLPTVFAALAQAFGAFLTAIVQEIPKLGPVLDGLFAVFGNILIKYIPLIANIGLQLIVALMSAIASKIGTITNLAIEIAVNFINALAGRVGDIAMAGANLMISFFNSMADAIATQGPALIASIENVILSVIEVIAGEIPIFGDYAAEAIERYRQGLEGGQPGVEGAANANAKASEIKPKDQSGNGRQAANTFKQGLGSGKGQIKSTATANANAANMKVPSQYGNGQAAVSGLISGLGSMIGSLRAKASQIANIVDRIIRLKNRIHSPSKRLAETGKYMMQGLIAGLDSLTPEYQNRAENIATMMIDSTNKAAQAIDSFSSPMNLSGAIAQSTDVNLRMNDIRRENEKLASGINKLNTTLSSMTETMNSRSLNNYITIDGAGDPEGFADDLIRSFRLNARTV